MAQESKFTVFVRLPFFRGDFVDPPPVRAAQFDVDLSFLLQQAAWLYERQLSQVKAQLRKVSKPSLTTQSPTPSSAAGSGVAGGYAMARTSSGGSRVPSSLAMRQKERPISQGEGSPVEFSSPTRGTRMSRNSSTNTVYQIQKASPTLAQRPLSEALLPAVQSSRAREASRRLSDLTLKDKPTLAQRPSSEALLPAVQSFRAREASRRLSDLTQKDKPFLNESPKSPSSRADNSSSSESESEAAPPLSRSRAYMRRPRHSNSKAPLGPLSDADEDDTDSPPFLPFSDPKTTVQSPVNAPNDPSATLRTAPRFSSSSKLPTPVPPPALTSSSSSAQSPQPHKKPSRPPFQNTTSPPHTYSNEPVSALSPRQRRVVRDGSDGTPSMGSSFSDLDDASVTQSALEEALAHEMNQGGVASRMSTISQALRSRYL
ncbi:MAG: hypothetical protein Q9221_000299 [Calogaya cf. arnoldii]